MYHKFLLIILLSIMLIPASSCTSANQVDLTITDNNSQIEIKTGGEIVIKLDGNPSTGYTWEPKDLDATMFEQVGEVTFTSNNPGLVGSDGVLTLTFHVLNKGKATLTLVYHRPWETGVDPLETFSVTLVVK